MPVKVTDTHRNEDGEQVTTRTVEVTDATGDTDTYRFEQSRPLADDDWSHIGDEDPSDTANEAVRDGPSGADGGETGA